MPDSNKKQLKEFVQQTKINELDQVGCLPCLKGQICTSSIGKYLWPKRYKIAKDLVQIIQETNAAKADQETEPTPQTDPREPNDQRTTKENE